MRIDVRAREGARDEGGPAAGRDRAPAGAPRATGSRAAAGGPRVRLALVLLESAVGLFAVWGGYQMIGGAWDLPMDWLAHTPFDSWLLPGVALLLLPGGGVLLAAAAAGLSLPGDRVLSMLAGAGLMAWIVVQLAWLQMVHPVMQPTIFAVGLVVLLLARRLPRRRADSGRTR